MKIKIDEKQPWLSHISSRRICKSLAFLISVLFLAIGFFGINRLGDVTFSLVLGKSDQAALTARDATASVTTPTTVQTTTPVTAQVIAQSPDRSPVVSTKKEEFFTEYRMERERTRSQQIELLREIVNNSQSPADTRKEAQKKILDMTGQMKKELEAEKLIVARGYKDAVVLIQPNTISVIVAGKSLSPEDNARIAQLVARATGMKVAEISVMGKG